MSKSTKKPSPAAFIPPAIVWNPKHSSPSTLSSIILAETTNSMNPDPNWLSRMKRKFTKAVENFTEGLKNYGYNSFCEFCQNIKTSYPIVERLFKAYDISFTEEIKVTLEVLQKKLVEVFIKMEAQTVNRLW